MDKQLMLSPPIDRIRKHFECPICLQLLDNIAITECNHRFCRTCIEEHLRKNGSNCPTCRATLCVNRRKLRDDKANDDFIKEYLVHAEPSSIVPSQLAPPHLVDDILRCLPMLEASVRDLWYKDGVTHTFGEFPDFNITVGLVHALGLGIGHMTRVYAPSKYWTWGKANEIDQVFGFKWHMWINYLCIANMSVNCGHTFSCTIAAGERKMIFADEDGRRFIDCSDSKSWRELDRAGNVLRNDVFSDFPWFSRKVSVVFADLQWPQFKVDPELISALGVPFDKKAILFMSLERYLLLMGVPFDILSRVGPRAETWRQLLAQVIALAKPSPNLEMFLISLDEDECRLVCRDPDTGNFLMFPEHGEWLEVKADGKVLHIGWRIDVEDDESRKKKQRIA